MSEANKALVTRLFDELLNKNNQAVVDQLIAPDSVHRINQIPELRGSKAYQQHVATLRAGFPDMQFTIEKMTSEGDRIATRFKMTGTHTGEWAGVAPTGRPVAMTGTATCRIAGSKLVEELTDWDALGFWKQIGLVTDPAVAETNKAVFRRFMEAANKRNLAVFTEIFTGDVVYRSSNLADIQGIDGVRHLYTTLGSAFPDFRFTVLGEILAQGDLVMARWTFAGTHMGEWMGVPPTGRRITIGGTTTMKLAAGRIAEHDADWDALGMFQQLGVLADPAALAANKALVRRYVEEILNRGELTLVDEIFTSDAVIRDSANLEFRGIEGVKQLVTAIRSAFPDAHYAFIGELVAERDVVVCQWAISGTQKGEWMGIAPAGNRLAFRGTITLRIAGGKIAEQWADYDSLTVFQQLGATPPFQQAKAAPAR